MTHHTSSSPPSDSYDVYDLSQIFIGRQHQLDRFDYYLTRWQQLLLTANPNLRHHQDPCKNSSQRTSRLGNLKNFLPSCRVAGRSSELLHLPATRDALCPKEQGISAPELVYPVHHLHQSSLFVMVF